MRSLSLLALLFLSFCLNAQVGINTQNPDPTSVLDLMANDKGLLIPRLTTVQRQALTTAPPANSLLVFDTDVKAFFYFNSASGVWLALNPLQAQMRNAADSIISAYKLRVENDLVVTGNLNVSGNTNITSNVNIQGTVNATQFSGNGIVPSGLIAIWSGLSTNIPSGWTLCNGTLGTPDLRERFIVGAGGDNPSVALTTGYSVATTGGNNLNTLTIAQLPSHNHTYPNPAEGAFGLVRRSVSGEFNTVDGGTDNIDAGTQPDLKVQPSGFTTNNTGSGNPIENRPPYYALCYIMKL